MSGFFDNEGFRLAFLDEGEGEPILLIHGFASSIHVNWVAPGWVKSLTDAGYRVIAFDHRGHGKSSASYEKPDYHPLRMASDAIALLDHLGIGKAHVMGYSMGARVSAFLALEAPERIASLILGGLGAGLVDGLGDWDVIADALLATDPQSITNPRGNMFRSFADKTGSDRLALAACIAESRLELSEQEVGQIQQPALVAVGSLDDIAGDPKRLADLLPHGEAFIIKGRDHMMSVGDRTFKKRAIEFLHAHQI